jgi:hypothetical protein
MFIEIKTFVCLDNTADREQADTQMRNRFVRLTDSLAIPTCTGLVRWEPSSLSISMRKTA